MRYHHCSCGKTYGCSAVWGVSLCSISLGALPIRFYDLHSCSASIRAVVSRQGVGQSLLVAHWTAVQQQGQYAVSSHKHSTRIFLLTRNKTAPLPPISAVMLTFPRSLSRPPSLPLSLPSFPQAISRMESLSPTPRLFMRSVNIMATNAAAPLIKWVLELLQRLITKQVGGCVC